METLRTIVRAVLLPVALAFLAMGALRTHRVYEEHGDFGVRVFERISEARLVEYATYSGVYAQEGSLIRYEWALRVEGKQKCPT